MSRIIHIVAGPTASGKSSRALSLAVDHDGIIVNCDSLQIYDGLPLLTAQPSAQEKIAVPHKLYGTRHPNDLCSAGTWRELALPVIEAILAERKTPIVCGGTGLYIKALLEGLSPMPDVPDEIRRAARQKHKEMGNADFHAMLAARDPVMAERLHPANSMRVIRAWEILEYTGKSLSEWQGRKSEEPNPVWNFEVHKIMPDREELNERCDARFEEMMKNNVLDEVEAFDRRILAGEIGADVPLTKALGFRALRSHIKGEISRKEAVSKAQTETRQYAKRQMTWFRHQL